MPTSVGHSLLGYIWYPIFKRDYKLIENWKTLLNCSIRICSEKNEACVDGELVKPPKKGEFSYTLPKSFLKE